MYNPVDLHRSTAMGGQTKTAEPDPEKFNPGLHLTIPADAGAFMRKDRTAVPEASSRSKEHRNT